MKVLVDFHHFDLFYSLHKLFEERMGWELYRPIGMDWFHQGFWLIGNPYAPEAELKVAKQFLGPRPQDVIESEGIYRCTDSAAPHFQQRAITFERFKQEEFDVIIGSIPDHIGTYGTLIQRHQPHAKFIFQMGNNWVGLINMHDCRNILASTGAFPVPSGVNCVFYHQEFDLDVFRYKLPEGQKSIKSFVNCFSSNSEDGFFASLETWMPEFDFKIYGNDNRDGVLWPHEKLAAAIHDSTYVWQVKKSGDGFGHVIHNSYACGRPVITRRQHYAGKLADPLLIHGETCWDIDKIQGGDLALQIRNELPEEHRAMCERSYQRFKEVVNFDAEFLEIQKFLEKLR